MNYSNTIYNSINELPDSLWNELDCNENIYFSKDYLYAFEAFNAEMIDFHYILTRKDDLPVSLAAIQILNYDFDKLVSAPNSSRFIEKIGRHVFCFLKRDYLKMIICGNTFLSGEHGIFIAKDQDKREIIEEILTSIQKLIKSDPFLKKSTDVILIKDFIKESLPISDRIKKYNFSPIKVDPTMVLELDDSWISFDDYLNAFKSKFRVKAKKAYKTSRQLTEKNFSSDDILENIDRLSELYTNVIRKSSFNIGTLDLSTYEYLKNNYPENFILKAYYLDDIIVGFMSGMINENRLDAHFIGLDYELNKEHAIYSRILYDYSKIGIEKGLKYVNFGRTSGEIKSTLGAKPQELTFYLRHKKSVANFFFKPFLRKIKPTHYEQRYPFKKEKAHALA